MIEGLFLWFCVLCCVGVVVGIGLCLLGLGFTGVLTISGSLYVLLIGWTILHWYWGDGC
jgi:hypothetical protein